MFIQVFKNNSFLLVLVWMTSYAMMFKDIML